MTINPKDSFGTCQTEIFRALGPAGGKGALGKSQEIFFSAGVNL